MSVVEYLKQKYSKNKIVFICHTPLEASKTLTRSEKLKPTRSILKLFFGFCLGVELKGVGDK